jgi:AcrR family transcriptional regulator
MTDLDGNEPDAPSPADPHPRKRRDLVESEIFERATALFAERGFAGTSLQDIADAMGMTRPALYHYVKNKNEILSKLVTEITEGPAQQLAAINAQPALSPTERLREMVRVVVTRTAQQPSRFRLLIRSESDLPPELSAIHERAKRRVLAEFVGAIEEGARRGEFRPVDARVAALGVLGLCNWVAWWHHARDGLGPAEIAEQLSEMAVQSIARPDGAPIETLADAVKVLRQDLDRLERVATGSAPAKPRRRKGA